MVRWWKHQFHWVHFASPSCPPGPRPRLPLWPITPFLNINNDCDSWNVTQPQCGRLKITVNYILFPISACMRVWSEILCVYFTYVPCCSALWLYLAWDYVHKHTVLLWQSCNCSVKMSLHSFISSFSILCWCNFHCTSVFSAIYSRAFKRSNQKLWTSSRETGPKHPEEPFCLTFIHSCSFSRVPPESIWQTLVKKKGLWGKKNNKSFLSHPHPICCGIIFFYYLQIMCADMISTVWSGGHCGRSRCFFVCDMRQRGGWGGQKKSSPMCI